MLSKNITNSIKELFRLRSICNKIDKKKYISSEELSDFFKYYYKYKNVIKK